MNKNVKKVTSAATLPCKYRGSGIECPIRDVADNLCPTCGWNYDVEADRIKEITGRKK
jgi:hypothetical protein